MLVAQILDEKTDRKEVQGAPGASPIPLRRLPRTVEREDAGPVERGRAAFTGRVYVVKSRKRLYALAIAQTKSTSCWPR